MRTLTQKEMKQIYNNGKPLVNFKKVKAGRPKIYTYEMKLTKGQSKLIGEALSTQGRITIKDFGILKLTGIKKSRHLNSTKGKVINFPARRKVNLRATGEFYDYIQAL